MITDLVIPLSEREGPTFDAFLEKPYSLGALGQIESDLPGTALPQATPTT